MSPAEARAPCLMYVVTEDWFFVSHFLPMARAAHAAGFRVTVAARVREHGGAIEAEGFALHPLQAERGSLSPGALLGSVRGLRRIMAEVKPDIVHCIALRSILVGGLAARLASVRRRVFAVTGLGFLGAATGSAAATARATVRMVLHHLAAGGQTVFLFENRDDPRALGLDPEAGERVLVVGGAGVDPAVYAPRPLPEGALKVAVVARMLWSKGIDIAVEAVLRLRAEGRDISLSLYGAPDPSNPRAIPESVLQTWSRQPGVTWHGPTGAVPEVWAGHHVALLPSRGGEGLPRTLLEAAACGRPLVTTDVPGCRDLVPEGREGFAVPPGDAAAVAAALARLDDDRALLARMGEAARARILAHHTEAAIGTAVAALYARLLGESR